MKSNLVYSHGINDHQVPVKVNGKLIQSYQTWINILKRCYDSKVQQKHPTYIGCTMSEEWLLFSNFKVWFDENYRSGMCIDKDILFQGNKMYSKETCRFVPNYINVLLTDRENARGELPLGITMFRKYYMAQCMDGEGKRLKKYSKSLEVCVNWYATTKQAVIKKQAIKALCAGEITKDVFDALINRKY